MKKIIGIIGIVVFAMTMSLNMNKAYSSNDNFSLTKLAILNTANAECNNIPGEAELDCLIWNIELNMTIPPALKCTTGGSYKCGFSF